MQTIDYAIIVAYFAIVIAIGFWYQRRAAKSLDSYFLGGKSMHWLALAMSGAVSTFDIAGTMWIVTLITLFGMKSMWNHWMWGFLMGAFFLAYMGKWVRRSRVMTGAEWMVTRFGDGVDGQMARVSYTLMAVVVLSGSVGYAFQGIGKFASVYIDLSPMLAAMAEFAPGFSESFWYVAAHQAEFLALTVFTITTLYVLLGGLYSVVITNVIQTTILTIASVLIAVIAYTSLSANTVAAIVPKDGTSMTSLIPCWKLENAASLPDAYVGYEFFGALVIMWVVKGLLLNLGGPGQMYDFQVFLSTRNPRDAAKLGAAWSGFLVVRWAMCMGIALLAITGIQGVSDPEKVMPMVLQTHLWPGVRGLVIAGLLAAFMSTFSATVNAAASYIVRDLWQPIFARKASPRQLIRASYVATLGVVVLGTAIGFHADSIRQVWDWIMMVAGAAFVVPNVLRWYWWRLNGWGYSAGTLIGMVAALTVPLVPGWLKTPDMATDGMRALVAEQIALPYVSFPLICSLSAIGCLAATLLTRPISNDVLVPFYENIRPFGFWGPMRRMCRLSSTQLEDRKESFGLTVTNVIVGSMAILGLYLGPMYLVGHWHTNAAFCFAVSAVAMTTLYFTWYRNLPETTP